MTRAKDISKILTDADISGNIDVDGVTNLDVVDIDGAVDMASTLSVGGDLTVTSSANSTLNITAGGTSNDSLINFVHGSTTDGGITYDHNGAYASEEMKFRTGNNTANMKLNGAGTLTVANGVTLTDGNLVVASGHGIDFSATANSSSGGMSSELLDDYEEGIFTPTVTFGGGATGIQYTSNRRTGFYTKVGNLVTYSMHIQLTNKGSSTGSLQITGLPFTTASNDHYPPSAVFVGGMASMSGGFPTFRPHPSNTLLDCYQLTNSSYAGLTNSNCTNSTSFLISGQYYV